MEPGHEGLSRRALLRMLLAAPAPLLLACTTLQEEAGSGPQVITPAGGASPRSSAVPSAGDLSCVVRPTQTLGPYFVEERLNRSDIRTDPSDGSVSGGVPLEVTFRVFQVHGSTCSPLAAATVDIWHCDAAGAYSDVRDAGFSTVGKSFLRGYQATDEAGGVRFTTIYPGWYQGRAVHIHFRIRTDPRARVGQDFVSQLYFDEAVTDKVHAQPPYAQKGKSRVRNEQDSLFRSGGDQLLLKLTEQGGGYSGDFNLGMQMQ